MSLARPGPSDQHSERRHTRRLRALLALCTVASAGVAAAVRVRAADKATSKRPASSPQHWPEVTRKSKARSHEP